MPYVEYEYYQKIYAGTLSEEVFKRLESKTCDVIEIYIASLIPSDRVKALDKYEFDVSKSVCYQLDLLNQIGEGVLIGQKTDADIKTLKTENFTYEYDNDQCDKVGNIPISLMTSVAIKTSLNQYGYFNKLVKQCQRHQDY